MSAVDAGGGVASPLVLHLADGRLAVIANPAEVVLYAAIDGTAGAHVPSVPARSIKRGTKVPAAKAKRGRPAKDAAPAPKVTRAKANPDAYARAKELHAEGLSYTEVHAKLLQEGHDVKYARVWGWLSK